MQTESREINRLLTYTFCYQARRISYTEWLAALNSTRRFLSLVRARVQQRESPTAPAALAMLDRFSAHLDALESRHDLDSTQDDIRQDTSPLCALVTQALHTEPALQTKPGAV